MPSESNTTAAETPYEQAWREHAEGFDAYGCGAECPYQDGSPSARRWRLGWFEAKQELQQ